MDVLKQWNEFKESYTAAKADGKLTMREIATIAKEGGEFVAELATILITFLPEAVLAQTNQAFVAPENVA